MFGMGSRFEHGASPGAQILPAMWVLIWKGIGFGYTYISCLIYSQVLRGARSIIPDTFLPLFLHSPRSPRICDYEYAGTRSTLQADSLGSHHFSPVKFLSAVMHPTIT